VLTKKNSSDFCRHIVLYHNNLLPFFLAFETRSLFPENFYCLAAPLDHAGLFGQLSSFFIIQRPKKKAEARQFSPTCLCIGNDDLQHLPGSLTPVNASFFGHSNYFVNSLSCFLQVFHCCFI
jgi:hypothetical protein